MVKRLTQEIVLEQFKEMHGSTYDYSEFIYTGIDNKITIICKEHGAFQQTPYEHRKGNGCPKCGNLKATIAKGFIPKSQRPAKEDGRKLRLKTMQEVLSECIEVHGDKYDYSKLEYVNSKTPVLIGCKVHGFVSVRVGQHLRTAGCPECGRLKKKSPISFNSFVERAREKHGDRYTYHAEHFTLMSATTKITCKEHGIFSQSAASHCEGRGCQKCALIVMGETHSDSQDEFIVKAVAKHGVSLDFSETVYTGHTVEVEVNCATHGKFKIVPHRLLKGQGCPVCSKLSMSESIRHSKEQFVEKATKVHGTQYDYTRVDYSTSKVDVEIICKSCEKPFFQTPHNHVAGKHGCPACNACGFIRTKPAHLYVLQAGDITKVGITNRGVATRVKQINKSSDKNFTEVFSYYNSVGKVCSDIETKLLRELPQKYDSPNERFDGHTECFLNVDIVMLLNSITNKIEEMNG